MKTEVYGYIEYAVYFLTYIEYMSFTKQVLTLSYRKPCLAPGGYCYPTTMIKDPLSCPGTCILYTTIRSFSKNTHADVAEDCTKHCAVALNM